MVYEHINSKGKKYFLHGKGKLFYFSGTQKENAIDLPEGYNVVENSKTGLPMLKKKE
ncbi:MAG: hypothetical protein PHP82_02565 [Candidatus ainarchaeum sp.]|nr:hypothetical protein [Candidatus ainarchaeum sp.]